jgi:intracellular septation protein
MKFLFDLFPVILFFLVFKLGEGHLDAAHSIMAHYFGALVSGGVVTPAQAPILLATVVAILATFLQIAYLLVRGRKVDGMLWVSLAVILVMGGATVYFHDENFIKWKPTILYWAFALILFVSQAGFKSNLMRKVMEEQIKLPEHIWPRVGYAWVLFFAAMGLLNLLVAFVVFKSDTSAWVSFKLFGFTGIFFVFIVGQTLLLSKYIQEEDA